MTNIAVHDLGAELNELTTLRQTHYQQANENGMVKQVSTRPVRRALSSSVVTRLVSFLCGCMGLRNWSCWRRVLQCTRWWGLSS